MMERANLLLITPDRSERERLCALLTGQSCHVHALDDVAELGEAARLHAPDVAVLDAYTSPTAAIESIRSAKTPGNPLEVPIIALVREGDSDGAVAVIEAGAEDWLGWPARPQELISRIAIHHRVSHLHEVLGARVIENRALSRQRDQMLSMLTHDMKSPLTIILGHLRLLEDGRLGEVETDDARRAIRSARRNTQRLISYIDDYLTVCHSLTDPAHLRHESIDVTALLKECVDSHEGVAEQENIQLRLAVDGPIGDFFGDEGLVTRAVSNLMGNALKFTGEGGHVEVGAAGHDGEVLIWVEDDGAGIAEDDLPYIFDPYQRACGSRGATNGVGLGLSVVRSVAEAHGGTVEVKSTQGKGSRFTMRLPRRPGRGTRQRALIIEDNPDFARILAMTLKLEGVESIVCTTAEEALSSLDQEHPDLITLDLMLPGMQGKHFLEELEKRLGTEVAPVLALSASERRLSSLDDIPMVRVRMNKDAFDQTTFRMAARELLEKTR